MKRISLIFCLVFANVFVPTVRASDTPKPTPVGQTKPADPPRPPPQLTEVEKLKIENLQLKYSQAESQLQSLQKLESDLRAEYQKLLTDVESKYPGYTIAPTGNSEPSLAPKPKPAEPVKK